MSPIKMTCESCGDPYAELQRVETETFDWWICEGCERICNEEREDGEPA